MNKYIPYLIILAIGALIGGGMCKTCTDHFRSDKEQSDTVYIPDTIWYSRLELTRNTYQLNVPKISMPELVYIPADSVTIIYRDSVRYVTLPREYYYTKMSDAEIWHSGVDSTIDSLVVFRENMAISKTEITTKKPKRHGVSIGVEANYSTAPNFPVQLEYSYNVRSWLNVYGYAEYELLRRQVGIGIGTKMQISW